MERKIISFQLNQIDEIYYQIRRSIDVVNSQNGRDICPTISMPNYFRDLLIHYLNQTVSGGAWNTENKELTLFGSKIIPAFDNFIVVFHEDTPLYNSLTYEVIDLNSKPNAQSPYVDS